MGLGPRALLDAGLVEALQHRGHSVSRDEIRLSEPERRGETRIAFQLLAEIAARTRGAKQRGELPLVLCGSCYVAAGVTCGLSVHRLAVTWFDAHADFNTPETTLSGYLDGMGAVMLWPDLEACRQRTF